MELPKNLTLLNNLTNDCFSYPVFEPLKIDFRNNKINFAEKDAKQNVKICGFEDLKMR